MEQYGKILLLAMPVFLALVLFEKWYGWQRGRDTLRTMDTISSLSSGVTNVVKDVLQISVSILSYGWMLKHLALVQLPSTFWMYAVAFLVLDFQGYWIHRLSHEINLFWNKHLIHHSSEDYNLACALRQSISSFVNLFTFFLLPAAVLGVPTSVIAVAVPIHLFAQFWYHTEHIRTMGFLERIIVTPAHHRVHHAINPEYMDKNYSQIFIFWDKLFGTFQAERPDVPPVYGITRPVRTWNPIKINFQHLWLLAQDAWRARRWWDKLRLWVMPTGWRPADVAARYPVQKIEDVYHFEKYEPRNTQRMKVWAWVQFSATILLVFYFFGNLVRIGSPGIFWYGGFVLLGVYSFTELMDRNPAALAWEALKNGIGLFWVFRAGDWFGMGEVLPWALPVLVAYFVLATLVTAWLLWVDLLPEARGAQGLRWTW
ncbi:MAG: sterol desaturase family protein [Saprospiraceae bacterium]|nr:sterol desaturase family protein [Saprospiraceae bacterium]